MTKRISQNLIILSVRSLLRDFVFDLLYWPMWWYSKGSLAVFKNFIHQIREEEYRLGLILWMKNILKPMYAQYDWQGRLISFFMRLIMIAYKLLVLLFWVLIQLFFLFLYFFGPIIAAYKIIFFFI